MKSSLMIGSPDNSNTVTCFCHFNNFASVIAFAVHHLAIF